MVRYLPLVWAGLARNRLRTVLTFVSIVVAFSLFGLLRGYLDAYAALADDARPDTLNVMAKYTKQPLPLAHLATLEALSGVRAIAYACGLGGYYQQPNQQVFLTAISDDWFVVYDNYVISPETFAAFEGSRTAAIVGQDLADEFGITVGERLPVISQYPQRDRSAPAWTFEVVGTFDWVNPEWVSNSALIRFDYFDEARAMQRGLVGAFYVKVADPSALDAIVAQIDAAFAGSPVPTRSATARNSVATVLNRITGVQTFVNAVVGTAFLTILIVIGGAMAQSLRERIPEFAVMKSFGFTSRLIVAVALAESIALCVAGAAAGLLVAQFGMPYLQPIEPAVNVPIHIVAYSLLIAIVMGSAAAAMPAVSAAGRTVVDALGDR